MNTPVTRDQELKEYLSIRKEAGRHIDPATAEVFWTYAQTLDPYGIDPDLPEEYQQIGREYFARSPGSEIWVWFGDLPEATRTALWAKCKHPEMANPIMTFRPAPEIRAAVEAVEKLLTVEKSMSVEFSPLRTDSRQL